MSVLSPRPWTREEFRLMAETGVLAPDERLELLDGVIVTKTTQNAPHVVCTHMVADWLRTVTPQNWSVRLQSPVALSEHSQPEPDVAVARKAIRDYLIEHPGPDDLALLAEISDSSLREDLRVKAALYARTSIEELWIFDINKRRLIVHQEPRAGEYRLVRIISEDEHVAPLFAPEATKLVRELLP